MHWTKKKQKLIAAAQKKANDSCDKGIAPDIAEISKGLDKAAIEKLNKLYNTDGSKMFDGTEELTAKDFNIKSQQAPTLTGNSDNVMSLKGATPSLSAISSGDNGVPSLGATNQKTTVKTAQTGLTCSEGSCLLGGLTRSQACAEVCCDEYPPPKSWCADLCKKYPSSSRCPGGTVKPPSTGTGIFDALKIGAQEFLKSLRAAVLLPLKAYLWLGTSKITEKIFPTANMLLRHAKDGDGKPLSSGDQSYLREKIKNTSKYKEALKEVLAQMEKDPNAEPTVTRTYTFFKNPDLYFAIKQFDVIGKRGDDGKIQIIFHDRYDYDWGDNPGIIGAWWQHTELIKPYPIDIIMQ